MAGIKMHQIRSFLAGVIAVGLVIVLAAFGTAAVGIRLPILSNVTDAFGFYADEGE